VHIVPNFYLFSRRDKVRITSYVSLVPTKKTDKKASRMYKLFSLAALFYEFKTEKQMDILQVTGEGKGNV